MTSRRAPVGVFCLLLASYGYFWHSRDWNSATRLMLTYSLVDRGTVRINGLEDHTRDRARVGADYYTDKQPGYSLLAVPSYAIARGVGAIPPHPLDVKGPKLPYWPGDYWATLGVSGVMTALCGAVLAAMAQGLGCGPRRAALVGLAYGLATPAYVYATLAYGHQATACLLLLSLAFLETTNRRWARSIPAGLCASFASVVEIQAGPASAILGLYLLGLVAAKRVRPLALIGFAAGAIGPVVVLIAYNVAAFGSPFDMGYFHEDLAMFQQVHAADNPLGLRGLDLARLPDLLWREHRGLLVFAPILVLAVPGWIALALRRRWGLAAVTLAISAAVLAVNLSYPEWTGGWSTGPRFLLPMIPFAMLAVAALLARRGRTFVALAVVFAVAGGIEITMFQMVGGRIPHQELRPLREHVWPIVSGAPGPGERFERTIGDGLFARWGDSLPVGWRWLRFGPFLMIQIGMIGGLMAMLRTRGGTSVRRADAGPPPTRDLVPAPPCTPSDRTA